MDNMFENAKFGDKYRTRSGGVAIYLSTEIGGNKDDINNPPFVIIHMALEKHIKYADGTEKRFHYINMYDSQGHFNRFDTETEYMEDVIYKLKEEIDND